MITAGRHTIPETGRTDEEQSIIDRIDAWYEKLKEFKSTCSEYRDYVEAHKDWAKLPNNNPHP